MLKLQLQKSLLLAFRLIVLEGCKYGLYLPDRVAVETSFRF